MESNGRSITDRRSSKRGPYWSRADGHASEIQYPKAWAGTLPKDKEIVQMWFPESVLFTSYCAKMQELCQREVLPIIESINFLPWLKDSVRSYWQSKAGLAMPSCSYTSVWFKLLDVRSMCSPSDLDFLISCLMMIAGSTLQRCQKIDEFVSCRSLCCSHIKAADLIATDNIAFSLYGKIDDLRKKLLLIRRRCFPKTHHDLTRWDRWVHHENLYGGWLFTIDDFYYPCVEKFLDAHCLLPQQPLLTPDLPKLCSLHPVKNALIRS